MSSLRSALEEWQAEDVDRLPVERLADDLVELELISGLVEMERLRRIASTVAAVRTGMVTRRPPHF